MKKSFEDNMEELENIVKEFISDKKITREYFF